MRKPFDPRREATRVFDRCCETNAPPTVWNLLCFEFALLVVAIKRFTGLVRHNRQRLLRFRRVR